MEFLGCLILLVILLIVVGFIGNNLGIISLFIIGTLLIYLSYRAAKNNDNKPSKNNTSIDLNNEQPEIYEENIVEQEQNADNEYTHRQEPFVESIVVPAPEEYKKYTRVRKDESDYTVLDFETTGLNSVDDEIIEVGAIKFVNDTEVERFHSYVYPQRNNISDKITSITGIDMDTVISSPTIDEIMPELIKFIDNQNIVAHNASFDMKFLLQNMYNESIEYQKFRVIDTLGLARRELPFLKNHKLETIKEFLKMDIESHDAQNDCLVTATLYQYIKNNQE
ncbi:exonuclease domain-containing protein [Vagococcus carniphilus]|uniref:3'-5' exonuclease n=1 Tax=Vagococcus carniphilus TaxID=218144 RepID=UPI0028914526|nr:exonuclease domain-containing protein [Vagococcus carniphilus]MDT2830874.1 exonuclease domain-containing protein [Vagococcus carniphilus]MDT2854037.1 exonuclease domain-containing protein [Vagococcus carniphilus]